MFCQVPPDTWHSVRTWAPVKTVLVCITYLCMILSKQTLDPPTTDILGCSRHPMMVCTCSRGLFSRIFIHTSSHRSLSTLLPSTTWYLTVTKYTTFTLAPNWSLSAWPAETWCMFEPMVHINPLEMCTVVGNTVIHLFVDGNCKPSKSINIELLMWKFENKCC